MTKQRRGLGRGLGALLPEKTHEAEEENRVQNTLSSDLRIADIETNPYQPRTHFDQESLQELADSIRTQGIIQPITVRELSAGRYQLISGERRLQASKLASLKSIPAYVRMADNQQMLEMALIENIQREDLNAMEVALSYKRLMEDCDLKQEELGGRVGKNRSTVNNYLRLLKLPAKVQAGLRDKTISMGHARAIVGLEDEKMMVKVFEKTVHEGLSVRKVEELIRSLSQKSLPTRSPQKKLSVLKNEHLDLQEHLAGWFGTKVLIKSDAKSKGEIKIPFKSNEQLEEILNRLKKK